MTGSTLTFDIATLPTFKVGENQQYRIAHPLKYWQRVVNALSLGRYCKPIVVTFEGTVASITHNPKGNYSVTVLVMSIT